MLAQSILWTHAIAALLFGGLTILVWRAREPFMPRRTFSIALAATALWGLAVAGIGPTDLATNIAETIRNLAWLAFMVEMHRRADGAYSLAAIGTVYGVVILVEIAALITYTIAVGMQGLVAANIVHAHLLLRMLAAVAALVLLQSAYGIRKATIGTGAKWIIVALAAIWMIDLLVFSAVYLIGVWHGWEAIIRGAVVLLAAGIITYGVHQKSDWQVSVSRAVAYRSLSLVAVGLYFAFLAFATTTIAAIGGDRSRILQTAFVLGSTVAILTLIANSWLRAWIKVKLTKHLFRHRYDYRSEWIRFTDTLGAPEGGPALDERLIKALADLTDSPGGLLLVAHPDGLSAGASWNWDTSKIPVNSDPKLAELLNNTGRIVELDAIRADLTRPRALQPETEADALPSWMVELTNAWVLVPLPHQGKLAGAILLDRPLVNRPLDWEDFDLLKVAGRQVASHLAEFRAQEALAEAQRFDEFNRRFAFILHDIKNLVSQLTLTARNAERHADNPEFRQDMIATLKDSAERMNALLARLSQIHRGRADCPKVCALIPLIRRVIAANRGQHSVKLSGLRSASAVADPAGLEQLLAHLIQNAIDASPGGEAIIVAVEQDAQNVIIEVRDQGVGMSPTFVRDKLFKPFVSSKPGGFGIGAFEAQQLATAMNARLEVSSREGIGTTFRIVMKAVVAKERLVEKAA